MLPAVPKAYGKVFPVKSLHRFTLVLLTVTSKRWPVPIGIGNPKGTTTPTEVAPAKEKLFNVQPGMGTPALVWASIVTNDAPWGYILTEVSVNGVVASNTSPVLVPLKPPSAPVVLGLPPEPVAPLTEELT